MNARIRYLGKWELGVLILCGAFVLLTIGAVGEKGRKRAKEVVCQANLRQWSSHFQDYVKQNDGKFYSGCNDQGYWWPLQLPQELQDWKRNRAWFCPMAAKPLMDEHGKSSAMLGIHNAWGIFSAPTSITYGDKTYTMNPNGIAGSLGLNGYLIPLPLPAGQSTVPPRVPPRAITYESGVSAEDGWRNLLDVPQGNTVPMFLEALRFDLWPRPTDPPAESEFAAWTGNLMARCCINRHDGVVNCLFVDGSVRKAGLKELWTLKWHRSFNTAGPWTKAGGAVPSDWPEWIRPFKDY